MCTSDIFRACKRLVALSAFCSLALCTAGAQTGEAQTPERSSVVATAQGQAPAPAALSRESEMECSGYIEYQPPAGRMEIIGAEQEQEQRHFAEGDYVYISGGTQAGVSVGSEYSVIRPRGRFTSTFSRKSGSLGMYTQEVGKLRVISVKQNVSVAIVTRTCDNMLLGDLLRVGPQRPAPVIRAEAPLDRFAEPTGKQQGRIVLARYGRELVSRDDVVFIDLGTEDNVKPGDYLTIYRPLGTGDVFRSRFGDEESTPNRRRGFESNRFRGGQYSNKAQRVKDPVNGVNSTVTTPEIEKRRPAMPRKIVGEIVIISVESRTAAAIITRTAQEIHTGDFVEVQ